MDDDLVIEAIARATAAGEEVGLYHPSVSVAVGEEDEAVEPLEIVVRYVAGDRAWRAPMTEAEQAEARSLGATEHDLTQLDIDTMGDDDGPFGELRRGGA